MTQPRQTITHLKVDLLTAHPDNIRDSLGDLTDLALSIREHGILQPITVTEHRLGGFLILAGHRRLAAARLAGLTSVPAIIRHDVTDPAEHVVLMLVENTQRRDLDPVEKAQAYGALVNRGLSQSEIARRVGCTPSTVNYYLTLLELDEESLGLIRERQISVADAVTAVREARQETRTADQRPLRGRPVGVKTMPYFGSRHPLYDVVRGACSHLHRPDVGRAGCGPCWEQAIVDRFAATHQAAV